MKKCLEPTCGTWMNTDLHDYCWRHEPGTAIIDIDDPWYRRDPAPRWVAQLAGFIGIFLVGVVVGFGFGLMR